MERFLVLQTSTTFLLPTKPPKINPPFLCLGRIPHPLVMVCVWGVGKSTLVEFSFCSREKGAASGGICPHASAPTEGGDYLMAKSKRPGGFKLGQGWLCFGVSEIRPRASLKPERTHSRGGGGYSQPAAAFQPWIPSLPHQQVLIFFSWRPKVAWMVTDFLLWGCKTGPKMGENGLHLVGKLGVKNIFFNWFD